MRETKKKEGVVEIVSKVAIALIVTEILAKANFHFAQEATLINILEISFVETYAPL